MPLVGSDFGKQQLWNRYRRQKGLGVLNPVQQDALSQALDGLWAKFLPLIEERVALLGSAAAAFAAGRLPAEEVQAAGAAAHKLAGVLGSFGLARGTALARELETLYLSPSGPEPASGASLISMAAELRAIVQNRR
jgi:HPt (histidine-containing phosphotransfer) domain-containing protein